jgi:hypothetical protein
MVLEAVMPCSMYRSTQPSLYEFVDDQHYGYTRITAAPKNLTMEYIPNVVGAKGDSFTLMKP